MFGKLFSGDWFFKDGDSLVIDYGLYNYDNYYYNYTELGSFGFKENGFGNILDIKYLFSPIKTMPFYFDIGISYNEVKIQRNNHYYTRSFGSDKYQTKNYKVSNTYLNFGISVDAWQNQTPFGKNNRQYFLLIGDLITLNMDYKFLVNQTISSNDIIIDYSTISEKYFTYGISTSWITKDRILFGWGIQIINNKINYKDIIEKTRVLNLHLGYIF